MKVKLKKGLIRWDYGDFHIRHDCIKECTPEIFEVAAGQLIKVKESKSKVELDEHTK